MGRHAGLNGTDPLKLSGSNCRLRNRVLRFFTLTDDRFLDSPSTAQIRQMFERDNFREPPGLERENNNTTGIDDTEISCTDAFSVGTCFDLKQQSASSRDCIGVGCHFNSESCPSGNAFNSDNRSQPAEDKRCGMVEFFAGSGNLSAACKSRGIPVVASLDIKHGAHHDMTRKSTQDFLCRLILLGNLFYCHFGTPCAVFSIARKGLRNFTLAHLKERISCELAFFTAKMCELCFSVGTLWSIENPLSSALWEFFPIKLLMARSDVYVVDFPMCAFGADYRKWTRVITNIPGLCSLQRECHHARHSVQLAGKVRVKDDSGNFVTVNKTTAAGAYPQLLVKAWSAVLRRLQGSCDVETNDSADTVRIEEQLKEAAATKKPCFQWRLHEITKRIPRLNQYVVYGQDSAAVRQQKKNRQQKAKARLAKAWKQIQSCPKVGCHHSSS